MKRFTILPLAALLFCLLGVPRPARGLDEAFVRDTKTYLSRLEKLGFAGVVLVAKNGEVALARGYGLADREHQHAWTPSTVSTIGSITKQFTAAAILRLQEKGLVGVRDRLGRYFEDVPPDKESITLHHLLTHSSGILDPQGIRDFDPVTRDEYVRRVLEEPLAFRPGERYEYSNANFSLLGAVIEIVTGKSYEPAMRDLVFDPAGLEDTGYLQPRWDDDRIAQGYEGGERWGTLLERPMAEDGPYWALRANGGIHSTALDMLAWSQALIENRVLSAESREALWTPYVDESNGDSTSFYGYGWSILDFAPGLKVVTHNGGNGIHFADLAIVPSRNLVVFLQTNVVADFPAANGLLTRIGERVFGGVPYPAVPEVVEAEPGELERWNGTYVLEGGERLDVSVDEDALLVEPTGWTAYALVHSPPDQDPEPLVAMSRAIEGVVGAYMKGDFGPLFDAYREQVPLDQLEEVYGERLREWEERMGTYEGFEVLGTGTGGPHHRTLIRFRYEKGDLLRAYVWDREQEGHLLGMMLGRLDPSLRFYPVAGGGFASWDPTGGASVPARFEGTGKEAARLLLQREGGEAAAVRKVR
jgi:CubicO group peptidase (beta-lactamase class C family)